MDIICERIDVFTGMGGGYILIDLGEQERQAMVSGSKGTWLSVVALGFRVAAIGQMVAVVGQALLAGLALSGDAGALGAHMVNGGLALLISVVQVVFGLLGKSQLPRWALIASVALFLGEGAQMASGRLHLFVVHLPLGLALFAGLAPLVLWITTEHATPTSENASEQGAVRSPMTGWPTGGN